jgi:glucuronate isomerase
VRLDPDRLLPADPATRELARGLYERVAGLPIISPHGHVDAALLLEDEPFADPAGLLIRRDHYVTRLIHAAGVPLERLGVRERAGGAAAVSPREVWRTFCEHWDLFAGTATGYWLAVELVELFGVEEEPCAQNADRLYDAISAALATDAFRPRALFERFRVEVLATTDDPLDDLAAHDALAADPTFVGRVIPTFRPDAYLDPLAPGWVERVVALAAWNGSEPASYRGYVEALAGRRRAVRARAARGVGRRGGTRVRRPHAARDGAHERRGRPRDDPAPGRVPQPQQRDLRPLRPRQRARHPAADQLRGGAAAAARAPRR